MVVVRRWRGSEEVREEKEKKALRRERGASVTGVCCSTCRTESYLRVSLVSS